MSPQHPDAETLAAFIDRTLPAAERQEVERHLASCADCRTSLTDIVAFLAAEEKLAAGEAPTAVGARGLASSPAPATARSRGWPFRIGIGLAAAAALVLAIWAGLRNRDAIETSPERQALVAAFAAEPTRPVAGRLTGGFGYAPAPPVTRGPNGATATDERSPEVRVAIASVERAAAARSATETRAALAIAQLIDGNVDAAIDGLDRATREQPANARFWSDLSAAYFASAMRTGGRSRFDDAAAAADRALQIEPNLPEALFNRALALEQRGGAAAARDAWTRVRDLEAGSGWSDEASEHLRRLAQP